VCPVEGGQGGQKRRGGTIEGHRVSILGGSWIHPKVVGECAQEKYMKLSRYKDAFQGD